jgi:hypothetical protein
MSRQEEREEGIKKMRTLFDEGRKIVELKTLYNDP